MSQDCPPEYSVDLDTVRRYVSYASQAGARTIYVIGSRSPLSSSGSDRPYRDWDFMIDYDSEKFYIDRPRTPAFGLHGDVQHMNERNDAVEIWPNDEYGVLT